MRYSVRASTLIILLELLKNYAPTYVLVGLGKKNKAPKQYATSKICEGA